MTRAELNYIIDTFCGGDFKNIVTMSDNSNGILTISDYLIPGKGIKYIDEQIGETTEYITGFITYSTLVADTRSHVGQKVECFYGVEGIQNITWKQPTEPDYVYKTVVATGITATLAPKNPAVRWTNEFTIETAAQSVNHAIYYRVINSIPTAPNVNDNILVRNWDKNLRGTNAFNIVVPNGKYIEMVEVVAESGRITKWGITELTNDGL